VLGSRAKAILLRPLLVDLKLLFNWQKKALLLVPTASGKEFNPTIIAGDQSQVKTGTEDFKKPLPLNTPAAFSCIPELIRH
jgi:hypothetical protein